MKYLIQVGSCAIAIMIFAAPGFAQEHGAQHGLDSDRNSDSASDSGNGNSSNSATISDRIDSAIDAATPSTDYSRSLGPPVERPSEGAGYFGGSGGAREGQHPER